MIERPLDSIGGRIAGVAHDLNNLLTIVLGNTNLTRSTLPEGSSAATYLDAVDSTVRRAGELTRVMFSLARGGHCDPALIDVNEIVREMIAMLQTTVFAHHNVRVDLASDIPRVPAVAVQLRQTLLNILFNAAEACGPAAGRIRVSTVPMRLSEQQLEKLLPTLRRQPGDYVRVRVVDNGCGIEASVVAKLFVAPVSTKGADRGTGLASVGQIISDHAGGVRLVSEPGRGTVFDVFLPLGADIRVAPEKPAGERRWKAGAFEGRKSGTILLADDTKLLRDALADYLSLVGYQVHPAASGQEALTLLDLHPEIDMVMLDVNMPGLDGFETLKAMRACRHDIPVVFMSGDLDPDTERRFAAAAPAAFLAKPFSLSEMKEVIGRIVSAA